MNEESKLVERVIGFDAHPDSFTAAILRGPTPAAAVVEKVFNKVPMAQLASWARKHTTTRDGLVLEASSIYVICTKGLLKVNVMSVTMAESPIWLPAPLFMSNWPVPLMVTSPENSTSPANSGERSIRWRIKSSGRSFSGLGLLLFSFISCSSSCL